MVSLAPYDFCIDELHHFFVKVVIVYFLHLIELNFFKLLSELIIFVLILLIECFKFDISLI